MRTGIYSFVIAIVILTFVTMVILTQTLTGFDSTTYTIKELRINGETLFFKRLTWGMSGDKQVSILSSNSSKEELANPDANTTYVYDDLGDIFYKIEKDTLFIFTARLAKQPTEFKTNVSVIQREYSLVKLRQIRSDSKYLGYEKL